MAWVPRLTPWQISRCYRGRFHGATVADFTVGCGRYHGYHHQRPIADSFSVTFLINWISWRGLRTLRLKSRINIDIV